LQHQQQLEQQHALSLEQELQQQQQQQQQLQEQQAVNMARQEQDKVNRSAFNSSGNLMSSLDVFQLSKFQRFTGQCVKIK
jgi:hypothetical protein